jgi:SAM-dependent methyltransferase
MSLSAWLYAIAIFLGSSLLFLVEPMAGKRLTPLLGGSAAVWITCLVFFQSALLLGYLCAHWMASRLRPRVQALVYLALLAASLAQAIINLHPSLQSSTAHPVASVFWLLSVLIGLPFLTLSATNPLLQSWYARGFARKASAGEPGAAVTPPYRLFALSNFGSLLGLVVYPWLIEPRFTLHAQAVAWLDGFVVFVIVCGTILWKLVRVAELQPAAPVASAAETASTPASSMPPAAAPSLGDRALWVLLAACGSLMLCAVTNHISQNIAAIPLMWILPLTIYLLTFVLAFSPRQRPWRLMAMQVPGLGVSVARLVLLILLAAAVFSMGYVLYSKTLTLLFQVSIAFFCLALFIVCLFCHTELHRLRPAPRYATAFYLLIAAGGALGSIYVGIVAPVVSSANYELVCGLAVTTLLAVLVSWRLPLGWRVFWSAATLAMIAVVYLQVQYNGKHSIAQLRNFYGTLRVTESFNPPDTAATRMLMNGTIIHGLQIFTDELRRTPTSYYTHDSGVGIAIDNCCGKRPRRIGVIGLGTGTVAAYGRAGDVIRFYDINPQVERIARSLFSYLRESQASIEIVTGDARVSLAAEPPQNYDVLIVDAFSGDAIPVHLLTREAIALYRRHLSPGGILAVHVSNRYLNLAPVVLQQAEDAGLPATVVGTQDREEEGEGEYGSDWVLVTTNQAFLDLPAVTEGAEDIAPLPGLRLWTDDYNSLLPLLKLEKFKWYTREENDE